MKFKELNEKIKSQFVVMQQYKLYRSELTGQEVWDYYISGFTSEQNPVFRDPNSSTENSNNDKNFIRRYGNILAVTPNLEVMSIFDIDVSGSKYEDTVNRLSKVLKNSNVKEVFFETFEELNSLPYQKVSKNNEFFQLGHEKTLKKYTQEEADKFGVVNTKDVYIFDHFHTFLKKEFVDMSGKSIETIMGSYRDDKNVFKRAMEEIPLDTLILVKDLIKQGSLLNGETHLYKVEQFIPLKREYDSLKETDRNNWCWLKSYQLPSAKFKNELIGVLCSELVEGKELNEACQSWNKRVDPANYMKATAPITKRQIGEARKFVEENGYEESFNRRFATIDDIKVSEILHSNVGDGKVKAVSIFDNVKSTSSRHKRSEFDGVETVSIDKFMKDILPTCTSVDAFLTNQQEDNLVSLTTTNNSDSKPIFKWDNNYSWTFNGNLAGKSQIKENVKSAGGKVDGVFRFSMMWADGDGDNSDLDLHCIEPDRNEIYYSNKRSYRTGGNLDIDITQPGGKLAVENITYPSLSKMIDGTYKLFVRQYSARGSKGFKAEVEFNGEIFSYEYNKAVSGNVPVAEVILKNGDITIVHKLPETNGSRELYGLETNQFHKVDLVCLSPNHWGENKVGNKHYFFMLNGCRCPTSIRSFHNENLISELLEHRKVMEVLGANSMIEPIKKQLSGLGFNATVSDELIVKLQGTHKRIMKIKFK